MKVKIADVITQYRNDEDMKELEKFIEENKEEIKRMAKYFMDIPKPPHTLECVVAKEEVGYNPYASEFVEWQIVMSYNGNIDVEVREVLWSEDEDGWSMHGITIAELEIE